MYSICRIANFMTLGTYLHIYLRRDIHIGVLALVSKGKLGGLLRNEAGIKIANFISPLNRKFRIS